MKIAMIGWEYPPQYSGGLGIHCKAIVRELTGMGVLVDFYLPSLPNKIPIEIPERMTLYSVEIEHSNANLMHTYSGNMIWDTVNQFRQQLNVRFQPEGIDIIHAHDWMGVYSAFDIAQRYHIPLVWTVHSTEYDRAAGKPSHPGILSIEEEAIAISDRTIAVSLRTQKILIEQYCAAPDKIEVIYNGIDTSPFEQLPHRDYHPNNGFVLYLGRVTGQKGPELFLEAARLVLLTKKDTRFMIAGEGELLGKLRRRARRLKINDRVEFIGAVVGDQVLECYRNAVIFILPAFSEPFGITVLEAMAAGLPTIITTTTGAGEIVKFVEIVKPNDPNELAQKIISLLENPVLRQTLGQEGAKEVSQYTWKRTADEICSVYEKLLIKN
ncbi:MAG: glycosyltransferase family 4 protein [Paenibacillaceae bacterium]